MTLQFRSQKATTLSRLIFLVCVEADVVATLFRRRRGAIAVDDSQVEKVGLVKPQYHGDENDIKTAAGLPPSKGAINSGVVDLRATVGVFCNGQFFPLAPQVQNFQDVIVQGMEGQLRRRAPASNGQVG